MSFTAVKSDEGLWNAIRINFVTEKSNSGNSNIIQMQDIAEYQEDKKCDSFQDNDSLNARRDVSHVNSDSSSLAGTKDEQISVKDGLICHKLNSRREVDHTDSDPCLLSRTKDGQIDGELNTNSNPCLLSRTKDGQIGGELKTRREVDHANSDPCLLSRTKGRQFLDESPNLVDDMDTDPNSCLSARSKDEHICDYFESLDSKTNVCADCPLKEELIERPDAETCAENQNSKRVRRSTKRRRDIEDSCPICGLTVRFCDLENHFVKEVENLSKIPQNIRSIRKIRFGEKGINNTFVQVKCNRENRLSAKVAKYTKKPVHCPVCSMKLTGTEDEINEHVLNCAEEGFESDLNVTGFDDSFEEYEFGNETRVRAISFVPGGYRALEGHSSNSKTTADVDEDLNVDIDDTLKYGKPQYTELDVIHNLTDAAEVKQLEQLRKAVLSDPTIEPNVLESRKWANTSEKENEESKIIGSAENTNKSNVENKAECTDKKENPISVKNVDESHIGNQGESTENRNNPVNSVQADIVSSLKEKIKNLEEQNSVKCLICLEPYTKPVVSTTCWHVYCEECWLMTMGVKKLCPQCNLIVFPSDLRRIYL